MKLTIEEKNLTKALALWGKLTKEEAEREMRKSGRVLALRLTNATEPFGMNAKVRKTSEKAVETGISQVYKTAKIAGKELKSAGTPKGKTKTQNPEQAAKAFLQSIKKGDYHQSEEIVRRLGMKPYIYTEVGSFDGGKLHQLARYGSTQRVPKNQYVRMITPTATELNKYKKRKMSHVGIAKAAWAECAAKLGGFSGKGVKGVKSITEWIQKLISKYGRGTVTVTDKYVELKNSVPWIGRALGPGTLKQTLDIQRNTLAKSVIEIVKHNSKKAGFA
jgi:hypothetical protein